MREPRDWARQPSRGLRSPRAPAIISMAHILDTPTAGEPQIYNAHITTMYGGEGNSCNDDMFTAYAYDLGKPLGGKNAAMDSSI